MSAHRRLLELFLQEVGLEYSEPRGDIELDLGDGEVVEFRFDHHGYFKSVHVYYPG